MGGRDWIAGESQTPDWNWEQQESTMLGRVGPATEEVQSIEEQGISKEHIEWLGKWYFHFHCGRCVGRNFLITMIFQMLDLHVHRHSSGHGGCQGG